MKYIYGLVLILSPIGAFMYAMLGMAWVYEGHGLNPWIAGPVALICLLAGYIAAGQLVDLENGEY